MTEKEIAAALVEAKAEYKNLAAKKRARGEKINAMLGELEGLGVQRRAFYHTDHPWSERHDKDLVEFIGKALEPVWEWFRGD